MRYQTTSLETWSWDGRYNAQNERARRLEMGTKEKKCTIGRKKQKQWIHVKEIAEGERGLGSCNCLSPWELSGGERGIRKEMGAVRTSHAFEQQNSLTSVSKR
jgi:hypothetical protein